MKKGNRTSTDLLCTDSKKRMADERPCVFLEQSPDQDPEDEDRKHVLEVRLHPAGHLHAGSHIDLRHVLVEAPAIAGGAEEDEGSRRRSLPYRGCRVRPRGGRPARH